MRTYRRRRFDWPLLAAGLVALPALALILPAMHRTNEIVVSHSFLLGRPLTLAKLNVYFEWAKVRLPMVLSAPLMELMLTVMVLGWIPGLRKSRMQAAEGNPLEPSRM